MKDGVSVVKWEDTVRMKVIIFQQRKGRASWSGFWAHHWMIPLPVYSVLD